MLTTQLLTKRQEGIMCLPMGVRPLYHLWLNVQQRLHLNLVKPLVWLLVFQKKRKLKNALKDTIGMQSEKSSL